MGHENERGMSKVFPSRLYKFSTRDGIDFEIEPFDITPDAEFVEGEKYIIDTLPKLMDSRHRLDEPIKVDGFGGDLVLEDVYASFHLIGTFQNGEGDGRTIAAVKLPETPATAYLTSWHYDASDVDIIGGFIQDDSDPDASDLERLILTGSAGKLIDSIISKYGQFGNGPVGGGGYGQYRGGKVLTQSDLKTNLHYLISQDFFDNALHSSDVDKKFFGTVFGEGYHVTEVVVRTRGSMDDVPFDNKSRIIRMYNPQTKESIILQNDPQDIHKDSDEIPMYLHVKNWVNLWESGDLGAGNVYNSRVTKEY
ncbi:MAG: hypothetical protein GOU98_02375 [Candidatus Altiarchaeota archaeon]|nr:hypothetical protein [Candidatus Altiarchaeota archaeon]